MFARKGHEIVFDGNYSKTTSYKETEVHESYFDDEGTLYKADSVLENINENDLDEMLKLYSKGRPPNSTIFVDDMAGSNILHKKEGRLVKFVIKNRHRYTTFIIAVQNLKSISAPIRKVASVLFIANTLDKNYRKDLYEIVQGAIPDFETFEELMNELGKEKYSFLSIYNNGHSSDVRINLNKKIHL